MLSFWPLPIKFAGEAGKPKAFLVPGVEKSSISLLKIIPVLLPTTFEPNLQEKINQHMFSIWQQLKVTFDVVTKQQKYLYSSGGSRGLQGGHTNIWCCKIGQKESRRTKMALDSIFVGPTLLRNVRMFSTRRETVRHGWHLRHLSFQFPSGLKIIN